MTHAEWDESLRLHHSRPFRVDKAGRIERLWILPVPVVHVKGVEEGDDVGALRDGEPSQRRCPIGEEGEVINVPGWTSKDRLF